MVFVGRLLLGVALTRDDREFLQGDLEEELTRRLDDPVRGPTAGRWYLSQATRAAGGRRLSRALHYGAIARRWNRDRRGDGIMASLLQDIRFSIRALRREPGFAAGALLTLALGIGATTTIFTFANGMMLRPLPYPDGDRLVTLDHITSRGARARANYLHYRDWVDRSSSFAGTAAYYEGSFNVATSVEPVRVSGIVTTGELFQVLRAEALHGRGLLPADDVIDAPRVVVIGHGLWERGFGSDPGVVGTEIRFHGRPHTVVGIMPPGFAFPETADLWVAARIDPLEMDRSSHYWNTVARLRDGTTLGEAQAELATIGGAIAAEHPREAAGSSASASPLREVMLGNTRTTILLFLGVVIFVQMIATVNVSNLLLARASARRQEVAIRAALGAGRARIVRWLMTESLLLAAIGGGVGILVGMKGRDIILASIPIEVPRWFDFSVDFRVVGFIFLLTAVTGVVFGLFPALHASRDLQATLKHSGEGNGSEGRLKLRSALVVAEVALALMLLIGAGLMMKGLTNFRGIDPGLETEGVLTMRVSLPDAQYPDAASRRTFFEGVYARAAALPGVRQVGAVGYLPYANTGRTNFATPEGFELEGPESRPPGVIENTASNDYFEVMGIPLLRGRAFNPDDNTAVAAPAAIINRLAAERFFPDADPIGKRIKYGYPDGDEPWMTIVGVVDNVRHWNLTNSVWPTVYTPLSRRPGASAFIALAISADPLTLMPSVREAVRQVDPDLPLYSVRPMAQVIRESAWAPPVYSAMFSTFAALALGLATVGLYGVISFSVGRRAHEMGIRRALGAVGRDVLGLIVRDAMRLVGIGVAIGLVGAAALMGFVTSILQGVDARDPVVYAVVTTVLLAVALLAAWVPGRRAARVDPAAVLRSD
jgi:putative ABC transport system permease protein